jgi:hypothetical protein
LATSVFVVTRIGRISKKKLNYVITVYLFPKVVNVVFVVLMLVIYLERFHYKKTFVSFVYFVVFFIIFERRMSWT